MFKGGANAFATSVFARRVFGAVGTGQEHADGTGPTVPMAILAVAVLLTVSLASIGFGSSPARASVRPHVAAASCSTVAFTTTTGGVNTTIPTSDTCSITSVTGTVAQPQYNISWNHTILGTICPNGVGTGCDVSSINLGFYDFGTSGPFGSFLVGGTGMGCSFAPGDFGGLLYSACLLGGNTYNCVANIVPDGRAAQVRRPDLRLGSDGLRDHRVHHLARQRPAPTGALLLRHGGRQRAGRGGLRRVGVDSVPRGDPDLVRLGLR